METLASLVLIKRDEDEEEGGDSSKIGFLK
jgi:hypothetical protein